jgi:hypothetical protein
MFLPFGSQDGSRGSSPKAGTGTQTCPRIGQEGNGYQRSADRVQGVVRTKVEEYRQYAQESLQLAGMTTSPEHRAVLVMMAQAWKLLAQFHCLAASPKYRDNQTLIPTHKVASM